MILSDTQLTHFGRSRALRATLDADPAPAIHYLDDRRDRLIVQARAAAEDGAYEEAAELAAWAVAIEREIAC